jgi:hypothetical protein
MNISLYIRDILLTKLTTVFSWGAHDFESVLESEEGEGGLQFSVDGFKHTGRVKVVLNWLDLFDVYLINQDGTLKEKIENVFVDSLISVIDNAVEKTEDYEERVKREYSLQ